MPIRCGISNLQLEAALTALPKEVVIADDGSGLDTREVVQEWTPKRRCSLKHVWQEDLGFRLARSRNAAIAAATGDYIVLIDGDMILQRRFIEDHMRCARPDCFVQGTRPRLSSGVTARLLAG